MASKKVKTDGMTAESAMAIIESVATGNGDKTQLQAAVSWLKINGGGDVFQKYVLEIVHTYKDKPVAVIPKINIPS